MDASQSTTAGLGMIVLHELVLDSKRGQRVLIVAFEKKSPVVKKDTGFQDDDPLDMHRRSSHFLPSNK